MKFAVIKLGARIANENQGISSFEAVVVSKMLSIGGNKVDCFTKVSSKDAPIEGLNVLDITENYTKISGNYDALVVLNGNINFFGGVETPEQLLNLNIINNFDGKVFYIFVDTALPLRNVWESVKAKPWGVNYLEKDILITRKDIIYVTISYNTGAVKDITEKTGINPAKVVYFPFEKYVFFNDRLESVGDKSIDLLYGANSFRPKREKKMVQFYYGLPDDIDVEFYGKMKPSDFNIKNTGNKRIPRFNNTPLKYSENLTYINRGICTLNISDTFNEGKVLNPRIYETVLANTISFIDHEYDPRKKAFSSPKLQDFLYVRSQRELVEKIKKLKVDKVFMLDIIKEQFDNSYISKEDISNQFSSLMCSLI